MREEEKKATHFANVEDLISNCNNWIYEEDRDAFYRWFDFGAMEDLINLIEKQNKELEPIRELGIPVKTVVAELNRLEDLEDDRVQMQQIINELRKENEQHKQLNVGIMTDLINDFIPKSVIRENIEELEEFLSTNFVIGGRAYGKSAKNGIAIAKMYLEELLGGSNE